MTRIEAFKALFGADANTTASKEAFDTIKSNPRPSVTEEGQLDADTLDSVTDFADRPVFYSSGLPDGNAKTVLAAGAASLAAAPAVPSPAAPAAAPAPAATPAPAAVPPPVRPAQVAAASEVIADPFAGLLAGAQGATASAAIGRVAVPPPGAASPGRRDDSDDDDDDPRPRRGDRKKRGKGDRGDDRRDEPKPPPPPPRKPVTPRMRESMELSSWIGLRNAAIKTAQLARSSDPADRAKAQRDFDTLSSAAKGYQEGQGGQDPRYRNLGWLLQRMLEDLRDHLDVNDPDQFRSRFNLIA